jgi:hypothetical protein
VSEAAEEAFGFAGIWVLSSADLYGGKIVAALDASIRAISLTYVTSSATRGSTVICAEASSYTC